MSKKLSYYTISLDAPEGKITFYARDQDAMQIIFGWAGTADQIDADFYGKGINRNSGQVVPPTKGKLSHGDIPWSWTFGPKHASRMLSLVEEHQHDDNYYDSEERKRLPDLKAVLEAILSKGAKT